MTDQQVEDRPVAADEAPTQVHDVVEKEISFEDAKTEEQEAPTQESAPEDVVDILVPKVEPKVWAFGPNGELEFVQRPLSFVAKMQWFSLVGDVLDKALTGDNKMSLNSLFDAPGQQGSLSMADFRDADTFVQANKMSLNSLFDAPGQPGSLSMADFRDADTFVQAVGKLLVHAPKFLTDSYCIWLNVPDFQRDLVTRVWTLPESEGGLSDDDGIEIIEIFIDQNYEALDAFFREKLGRIQQRAQQRAEAATTSRQSRR